MVVSDPLKTDAHLRLAAALYGTRLAPTKCMQSQGTSGSCIAGIRTIKQKRKLWMSHKLIRTHHHTFRVMHGVLLSEGARWALVASRREFIRQTLVRTTKAPRLCRPFEVLALVSDREKRSDDGKALI